MGHNCGACVLWLLKPECLKPVFQRSYLSEKPMYHKGEHLLLMQLEKTWEQQWRPRATPPPPIFFFFNVTNYFGRNAQVDIRKGASPKNVCLLISPWDQNWLDTFIYIPLVGISHHRSARGLGNKEDVVVWGALINIISQMFNYYRKLNFITRIWKS